MSKCWYCNEELTTANYCDEHIGICTKCYGSMFNVSNEFVKGLTDKIADLEAKLAEKESEVKVGEFWHSAYQGKQLDYDKVYAELRQSYDENEQLKQQLAEKNKQLRAKIGNMKSTDFIKMCISCGFLVDAKVVDNQDKISFCVEQLKNSQQEKFELLEKLRKHYCHLMWDGRGADECWVIQECVDILDKQIEELKKENGCE